MIFIWIWQCMIAFFPIELTRPPAMFVMLLSFVQQIEFFFQFLAALWGSQNQILSNPVWNSTENRSTRDFCSGSTIFFFFFQVCLLEPKIHWWAEKLRGLPIPLPTFEQLHLQSWRDKSILEVHPQGISFSRIWSSISSPNWSWSVF